ncbi:hypothetical protein C6496_09960 [Candidatus Poribacteria bacterium]|nr:MAG: hypothetical protein C6496_09960 [Candidatus Poribacteria bacterium]
MENTEIIIALTKRLVLFTIILVILAIPSAVLASFQFFGIDTFEDLLHRINKERKAPPIETTYGKRPPDMSNSLGDVLWHAP